MKENRKKGFSMIELIVVVALIGIFTALATIAFGYIKSGNIKSTAKTIDSTLNKLKLDTMSKEKKPYMCIYKDGDDYYMLCTTNANEAPTSDNGQRIGNGNVSIKVDDATVGVNDKVYIAFKKGSGTFAESINADNPKNTIHKGKSSKADIVVESADGDGTSYVIHLIKDTGKHYIEIK